MNKAITNYKELIEEQQRMRDLLQIQKLQIKKDLLELKQELKPVLNTISFIGKLTIPDTNNNGALKLGTNVAIDWILRKVLYSSSPLLGYIVPPLIKNLSSHYVGKALPLFQKVKDKFMSRKLKATKE